MWGVVNSTPFGCEFLGPGVLSECAAGERREALRSRVLCTVTGCIPFPFVVGQSRTVGLPEADRSSGYVLSGCVGDPLFGANPCGRQTGFRAERCWLPSSADIVRVPGETLKTLKIKGRAWPFEKLCVYLRAFVPGCVRTYADAKAAKTRETKARRIFFG